MTVAVAKAGDRIENARRWLACSVVSFAAWKSRATGESSLHLACSMDALAAANLPGSFVVTRLDLEQEN